MGVLKAQGKGTVFAEPDIVTLSFEVAAKDWEYAESVQELNKRTDALRSSVESVGHDRTELKTTSFSVRTATRYDDGHSVFDGYEASHCLRIQLPLDKELLNNILHSIATGGSETEMRISFSVKDRESLKRQAIEEAVSVAKKNAEVLAKASGVKLGKIEQIEYGWSEVHIYDRQVDAMCAASPPDQYDVDVEPEDVSAEDNVTLVYELTD